ncbi:hypothetical protein RND81_05G022500 [Saponaria officinalis]|uniref:protein-serine/threonine phosphatase n=1 Tax=Saponaria officinalis TaxID=3572 RepID=A0AAW1KPY0_SAPOF
MGNVAGKLTPCLCPATAGDISRRHDIAVFLDNPLSDEGLGHSFCYIKPDNTLSSSSTTTTTTSINTTVSATSSTSFTTISGASISANASTALSTTIVLDTAFPFTTERASSFASSPSFASVPLQPIPRSSFINSGPIPTVQHSGSVLASGPVERGFLSGPIERGFTSGPLLGNNNLEKIKAKYKVNKWGSIKGIKDSFLKTFWGENNINNISNNNNCESVGKNSCSSVNFSSQMMSLCDESCDIREDSNNTNKNNINNNINNEGNMEYENVQWAEGKAGEDRVQVVVSEEYGWIFVGIYDGFNGPDAPDFLLANLYSAVHKELNGVLMWNGSNQTTISEDSIGFDLDSCVGHQDENGRNSSVSRNESQILELDEKVREKLNQLGTNLTRNLKHSDVLKALSNALRKTEDEYLEIADKMVLENPELSMMGSCVLAMLLIGEDVYLMNVGDSRAVLGQKSGDVDLDSFDDFPNLTHLQLTVDHNTNVKEEVQRIKKEHPDDPYAIVNDRVKGSLEVTRAFGAGFLKQPKWNDALLEMFRINYVGTSPYLTCSPSLIHHKLTPHDKFIILSSDGLYQYFTNEEAVSEVEFFMASTPEGDPAQHLVEHVLFRAAKKSGMDFYELLEIPQGERRRYHDDVSVIVISLEGRIWRSSV